MTIKDIAKITGYAVSTVSRAINGHPDVSEDARAKILECVEQHNFKLNKNAKYLKQSNPHAISIIVKGIHNMMFAPVLENMQENLKHKAVNIHYIEEEENEVTYAQIIVREYCPVGIIFLGGLRENFEREFHNISVPSILVTLDASDFCFKNLSSICLDDKGAAKCAVNLLLEHGHTKIGIIAADVKVSGPAHNRAIGIKEAFEEHGLQAPIAACEIARFSFQSSYDATLKLLQKAPNITAIFCMADIMAIGTLRAIYDLGKTVPNDISIVGFDGLDLIKFCVPRINTIQQDVKEIAKKSVSVLEEMIEHNSPAKHYQIIYSVQNGESIKTL